MKRHEKLIPLSRDHHQQLLLARLIRDDAPAYKGLPDNPAEKLSHALKIYRDEIIPHLTKESALFALIETAENHELNTLIEKQREYQTKIRQAFHTLALSSMDSTGRLLEEAIRHEERMLFQAIQDIINMDKLDFKP